MTKPILFFQATQYTRHAAPELLHTLARSHPDLRSALVGQILRHTMGPTVAVHDMSYDTVHGKRVPNGDSLWVHDAKHGKLHGINVDR